MIKPLTSLRFVFALMVFVSHLSFLEQSESDSLVWIYDAIFYEGYVGVSFFFILSGFILAYNYQDGIITRQKSKRAFYIARFARIFPLHVLTLIVSIPLTLAVFNNNKLLWLSQLITNSTLTQSFIPLRKIYFSFNAPSWSISNEMFFYVLCPLLIGLIPKLKKFKNFTMICIVTIIPLLSLVVPEHLYHQLFYINPFTRIFDFIIGIILFNYFKKCKLKKYSFNYDGLEISSVLIFVIFFIFHQYVPEVARYSFYYWLPMLYLIFSFSFQKGIISNVLSKRIFIYLGEISFGFYMFHQLVLKYLIIINTKYLHIGNDLIIILLVFLITLIISHCSYKCFEIPMNKFIRNRI